MKKFEQIANFSVFRRITRAAFLKSNESDSLLEKSESLFRFSTHKKPAIHSKNQRANSQPSKFGRPRTDFKGTIS